VPVALLSLALVAASGATPQPLEHLGLAYRTGWSHDEHTAGGFAYFSAKTFVDCAHTRVGYRQSADIFTGGYAHDAHGGLLSYADMGVLLENDGLARGELARPDKVQLYGQASTTASARLLRFVDGPDAPQRRFDVVCDTPLRLTFFVASPAEVDVRYQGTFVAKRGKRTPFTGSLTARIRGFAAADGWSVTCAFCAVRRVDTLAVGSGGPTRPGAYFGILDARGRREPVAWWSDSEAGRYVARPAGARASYQRGPFAAAARDIIDAPQNARTAPRGRPAFLIRGEGTANERIGLDQR